MKAVLTANPSHEEMIDPHTPTAPVPTPLHAAVTGGLAASTALAAGELAARLLDSNVTLVTAIGTSFIDRLAGALKDVAVALFGTNDKPALIVGIVIVSIVLAAALGVASRRWLPAGPLGIAAAGAAGAWTLATDPLGSTKVAIVAGTVSIVIGLTTFALLWRAASASPAPQPVDDGSAANDSSTRRRFLVFASAAAIGAAITALIARRVGARATIDATNAASGLPEPQRSASIPDGATVDARGVTSYLTPNDDFYRIDTALITPRVSVDDWALTVRGLVDTPITIGYDELLAMDSVEVPVTLQCVSNEVGGRLIGNAVWQGVPLVDLLDRAGVQPSAEQVVGRSVDGFTAGFPLADARDGRSALVAYAMNGELLPVEHGYPARLVIAGLYGYVSATKWLSEIELTTWDGFDGYWVPRGWSKTGPVKTQSRIDVPNGDVVAGTVMIAGVAWATGRGVDRVEVQVDDEPWRDAELGAVTSDETWRTWRLAWDAVPGNHRLRVRATDATGETQTADEQAPAPDGATGWHTRSVTVE